MLGSKPLLLAPGNRWDIPCGDVQQGLRGDDPLKFLRDCSFGEGHSINPKVQETPSFSATSFPCTPAHSPPAGCKPGLGEVPFFLLGSPPAPRGWGVSYSCAGCPALEPGVPVLRALTGDEHRTSGHRQAWLARQAGQRDPAGGGHHGECGQRGQQALAQPVERGQQHQRRQQRAVQTQVCVQQLQQRTGRHEQPGAARRPKPTLHGGQVGAGWGSGRAQGQGSGLGRGAPSAVKHRSRSGGILAFLVRPRAELIKAPGRGRERAGRRRRGGGDFLHFSPGTRLRAGAPASAPPPRPDPLSKKPEQSPKVAARRGDAFLRGRQREKAGWSGPRGSHPLTPAPRHTHRGR